MTSKPFILKGILISGLGEGQFYMKKKEYKKAFKEALNYNPWPGTFNIKLGLPIPQEVLKNTSHISIKGFEEKGKIFGNVKCYPCKIKKEGIQNLTTHLVVPEKTRHERDIIELISPVYLREFLNIKEGNNVVLSLKVKK